MEDEETNDADLDVEAPALGDPGNSAASGISDILCPNFILAGAAAAVAAATAACFSAEAASLDPDG